MSKPTWSPDAPSPSLDDRDRLPPTGHALGVIAQLWILINGLVAGGTLSGVAGLVGAEMLSDWISGRPLTDRVLIPTTAVAIVMGAIAGLLAGMWIIRRLSVRSTHAVLQTITLIPVLGVYFGAVLLLSSVWMWWTGRFRVRPPNSKP